MISRADIEQMLSPEEAKQLGYCESKIRQHKNAFMDAGAALLTIRNKKLYRATHQTFEAYCPAVLEITDRRARQLMEAFETVMAVQSSMSNVQGQDGESKTGTIVPLPTTESQARELAKVDPEQRAEVLRLAAENGAQGLTAKAIKEAALEVVEKIGHLTPALSPLLADSQRGEGERAAIGLSKLNFRKHVEKLTTKLFELTDHADDAAALEWLEEELMAAAQKIRERRVTMSKAA